MLLVEKNEAFLQTTLAALNRLTHDGAFGTTPDLSTSKYIGITPLLPPSNPYAHSACYALIYRMCINPFACKIKTSPGLDLGTLPDISDKNSSHATIPGGATTKAKDSIRAGNTAHFGSSQSWCEFVSLKEDRSGKGSGAKIVWNPFAALTLNSVNGTNVRETVPAYIVLAHELSHADRMMRGRSLVGVVGKASPPAFSGMVTGTGYNTMVDIEHIEMVGFASANWTCKDPDVITENQMRGEHHLPLRVNY